MSFSPQIIFATYLLLTYSFTFIVQFKYSKYTFDYGV